MDRTRLKGDHFYISEQCIHGDCPLCALGCSICKAQCMCLCHFQKVITAAPATENFVG